MHNEKFKKGWYENERRTVQSLGKLEMKAEHLKTWLREAPREKDPDSEKWDKFVSIMKVAF